MYVSTESAVCGTATQSRRMDAKKGVTRAGSIPVLRAVSAKACTTGLALYPRSRASSVSCSRPSRQARTSSTENPA